MIAIGQEVRPPVRYGYRRVEASLRYRHWRSAFGGNPRHGACVPVKNDLVASPPARSSRLRGVANGYSRSAAGICSPELAVGEEPKRTPIRRPEGEICAFSPRQFDRVELVERV